MICQSCKADVKQTYRINSGPIECFDCFGESILFTISNLAQNKFVVFQRISLGRFKKVGP